MPTPAMVRRCALMVLLFGLSGTVICSEFDHYEHIPGYEDHCFGGDLGGKGLEFNGGNSQMKVSPDTPDLTEFTICWWMKTTANNAAILVEYSSKGSNIKVENPANLRGTVNGDKADPSGIETNYDQWQHVCATWHPGPPGSLKYYKSGYMLLDQLEVATGQTIAGGGELVFGDNYNGEMTQFNMWSKRLLIDEIQALSADSLNPGCGDVIRWSSLKSSNLKSVQMVNINLPKAPTYPRFCMDEDKKDDVWTFEGALSRVEPDFTLPELVEFTICLWIQVKDISDADQTILSYHVSGDTDGSLVVENLDDLQMVINNQRAKSSRISILDGQWHHVCVAWESKSGQHKYYKDGDISGKKDLAQDSVIRTGGDLVVGQKIGQDGSSFVATSALKAKVALLNMWKMTLKKDVIAQLAGDRCERVCGDLIWWPYFQNNHLQNVITSNDLASDLGPCGTRHHCEAGVLDEYLWKINNTGDWSLAPLPKKIPDLTEFTICYWMYLDEEYGDNSNVAFSYFVPGDTEGSIVVENVGDLVVIINNQKSEPTGINLHNLTSHMLCLTWSSHYGEFTIYDRKEPLYTGRDLAMGQTVKGGGYLVVGQKQSIPGGGFNKDDAFNGRLRYFNFYSKVLDKKGIKMASRTCTPDCGDVVSWRELTYADLINIDLFNFTCGGGSQMTTVLPTTLPPTTKEPTTLPPTTKAPTTLPPSTKPPTTHPPTTKEPTTLPPTTDKPTTLSPTAKAPTTLPPTTMAPTTAPDTTKEPTIASLTTKEPTTRPPTPKELTSVPITTTRGPKTPPVPCLPEKPSLPLPCPDVTATTHCKEKVPPCLKNIALGKCTQQSSSHWYTQSSNAVDGSESSSLCYGSCTFTREEVEPWWRIDLAKPRIVNYISLFNAQDCLDEEHLLGAEVRVGNFKDFRKNNLCGVVTREVAKAGVINLECRNGPLAGRYVTVQIRCRKAVLCLCEVQVWSDDTDHEIDDGVDEDYRGCHESKNSVNEYGKDNDGQIGGGLPPGSGVFTQFQQFFFNMCCAPKS